jgi:hypothetical protein
VRSLPWSAALRVGLDAAVLVAVALPVVVAATVIEPRAAIPVLSTLPFIALRSAAAIRQAPGRTSGAAGPVMIEGFLAAALVALVPWTAAVLLASIPLLVRLAAEAERRQEIGRWHELHHLSAGDPMSWSDT